MSTLKMQRRALGKAVGSFLVTFAIPGATAIAQTTPSPGTSAPSQNLPRSFQATPKLNGWIRVQGDGSILVFTGKAELGQGILTALAQIASEELDVAFSRIQMVAADTSRGPDEGYTFGSQSIEQSGSALRVAGAEARAFLVDAAAAVLGLPASSLQVLDGTVSTKEGRSVTYWDLARRGLATLDVVVAGKSIPKEVHRYDVVGKSIQRPDLLAKVAGGQSFVHDMRLPDMVHGRVVVPAVYGAALLEVDEASVRRLPGILAVVRDGSFLGVVAQREEQAIKARTMLVASAKWLNPPLRLPAGKPLDKQLRKWRSEDKVIDSVAQELPIAADATRLVASYSRPYLAHASVGPSCAVALFKDDRMTVWSHTQGAYPLRGDLAKVLGLPNERVDVIHVPGSGCYGHNGADDAALDAALLARAVVGRPIRVQWMREDEFAAGPLSPAMAMTVRASVSPEGRIVDWDYEVWSNSHAMRPGQPGGINLLAAARKSQPFPPSQWLRLPQPIGDGDRNAVSVYVLPRRRVINHLLLDTPIRCSSLRTLGGHSNVFAIESFMDELAAFAEADPVAFRKAHLADPRAIAVIDAVVERAAWQPRQARVPGKGRGFAYSRYKNTQTYAAVVVDIAVDAATGKILVEKVYAAIDVGRVINPDGVKNQIEGGMIQSLSWTLYEQVTFDAERITSRDWASYPIMTATQTPDMDIILIDRPNESPLGAGEGSLGPASAAVANAFANATGKRIRHLPMTPDKVKTALL